MQDLITGTIDSLGYLGIALLMFAETVLPFIPSEIIMPFAGFAATGSGLSLYGVIIAGTLGSSLGAILLYLLARWINDQTVYALIDRYGRYAGVSRKDYDRADAWFSRHALPAVFFGRLVPGVRSAISVPAGLARMPLPLFISATVLGSLLWTAALAAAGYVLGERYDQVERVLGPVSITIAALIAGAVLAFIIRRRRQG